MTNNSNIAQVLIDICKADNYESAEQLQELELKDEATLADVVEHIVQGFGEL